MTSTGLLRGAASWLIAWHAMQSAPATAEDWPQWRGPDRNARVPAGVAVPTQLPASPRVAWRVPAGEGLSSPVVAGTHVYLFDAADGREVQRALDRRDGREVWRAEIDETFRDSQGPAGPRCTPVVDGDRVYALSCRGKLHCLNVADGSRVWSVDFAEAFGAVFVGEKGAAAGAARHGNNGSPLVTNDRLYVQAGGTNGAGIVCLDKRRGTVVWRSQNDQAAYAPMVRSRLGGIDHLLAFTVDGLVGLREVDGGLLWRVPMKTAFGRHVTTPVVVEDLVVVGSHQAGLVATRVRPADGGAAAEPAWLSKEWAMNFASPVVVGRHLYGLGPTRNLVCIDVLAGKIAWSKDGYFTTSADKAHAGFIVMGSNILMLTDGEELVLFKADPSAWQEISRVQVCALNWCNPAYADGRLFVRDGVKNTGELLCVELLSEAQLR